MRTAPATPTADLSRSPISAREDERRRWARELHDDTLQSLAALRLQLACARRGDAEELRTAVEGAMSELDREIGNLRALITDLRPPALDRFGLAAALQALADRVARGHAVAVTTTVDGRARLDPELETAVYRVVQEALTNAVRHGGARAVDLSVVRSEDALAVTVRDDGRGFDPCGSSSRSGFGLAGMRERVELLGGHLRVGSSRRGTEVTAWLPLRGGRPSNSDVR